jgi:hypothetical protein
VSTWAPSRRPMATSRTCRSRPTRADRRRCLAKRGGISRLGPPNWAASCTAWGRLSVERRQCGQLGAGKGGFGRIDGRFCSESHCASTGARRLR